MKAVAIPYVIALVLGIAVIGLIGYWFVSQGGKTVGEGSKAECQAKIFSYCVQWQSSDKDCDSSKNSDKVPTTVIEGCNLKNNKPDKSTCGNLNLCK